MRATWDDMASGTGCPMDYPRAESDEFLHFVRKLPTSSLYLSVNQAYRGHCVLIYDAAHVTRIDQLSSMDWSALAADLHAAQAAIVSAFQPDHVNLASLGNVVPHLHWHIVPRYRDDGRWGAPIWLTRADEMPVRKLAANEYHALAARIDAAMDLPDGRR